jgi:opacity protein-like surface antigen
MRTVLMPLAALLLAAVPAASQTSPFSLEVRVRAAFPTGDFGEEEEDGSGVETGSGGTLEGVFQATPVLAIYAGYSHTVFGTDLGEAEDLLEDASVDITDGGLDAGVRATLPLLNGGAYVRGGLVYHRVGVDLSDDLEELLEEFSGGEFDEDDLDSDWSLGYQLDAGVLVPLGSRLSASFGAAYTRYEPKFEDMGGEGFTADGDVSYASAEVGLLIRL